MNPDALINQAREHYLDQFRAFVVLQSLACSTGSAEVKFRLSDESEVYQHLYCADFVKNDGEPELVELIPDSVLEFDEISGAFGETALTIKHLQWDDIVVHHDAPEPVQALTDWFEKWFDPQDNRQIGGGAKGNVIHSLLVKPGTLNIDLGSAESEALWEMLDLLEASGAKSIRIAASRKDVSGL